MYGVETSPCNVEEYVANVQAGDGYYLDPGWNGGWCKTLPAAIVESVREDVGTGNWQSHATGVTYLPRTIGELNEILMPLLPPYWREQEAGHMAFTDIIFGRCRFRFVR